MPDQPAKSFLGFSWGGSAAKSEERLATPEELAEYGALGPDPETEAKILALFEEQLLQDLIRESPAKETLPPTVDPAAPAAATETATENPVKANEPAEAQKVALPPEVLEMLAEESVPITTDEPAPEKFNVSPEHATEVPAAAVADNSIEQEVLKEWAIEPPVVTETEDAASVAESPVAASGDLLQFAEQLDQHRLWVESAGKEGVQGHFAGVDLTGVDLTGVNLQGAELQKADLRGADLSMANLRNANLVEADLRDTNLLGTEFSGANLMGANLYGAQGLWAGRLGGTNLFDATLPEAVAALNGRKTIEQFTQAARWFYLMLMAVCVAALGLIALTTDVRLAAGRIRHSDRTDSQSIAAARFLSGSATAADRVVHAAAISTAAALGKHGRAAGHVSGRTDAGEGRPVVPDGRRSGRICDGRGNRIPRWAWWNVT